MTPEVPTITLAESMFNRALLDNVPSPHRKVSIRTVKEPTREYEDKIICATDFSVLYPHLQVFSKYVESDDFQYLSLHVDSFVLQVMRWI